MGHKGKRVAQRVGPRRPRSFSPALLLLALGVTLCVVAWGYLVKAAIDFGASARGGQSDAWWFLALASLGAVACLFIGLLLIARITRRLGITQPAGSSSTPEEADPTDNVVRLPMPRNVGPSRHAGGRRAAR